MISREMLRKSISQIATNSIGTLQSVDGNAATVVIDGQVYPEMMLMKVFDCQEFEAKCPVHNENVNFKPFDWDNHVGEKVLVSLLDGNHSKGVVVGVIM